MCAESQAWSCAASFLNKVFQKKKDVELIRKQNRLQPSVMEQETACPTASLPLPRSVPPPFFCFFSRLLHGDLLVKDQLDPDANVSPSSDYLKVNL